MIPTQKTEKIRFKAVSNLVKAFAPPSNEPRFMSLHVQRKWTICCSIGTQRACPCKGHSNKRWREK